jgi:hypothetical protein
VNTRPRRRVDLEDLAGHLHARRMDDLHRAAARASMVEP